MFITHSHVGPSRPSRTTLVLLLGALSAFPALSIDMYLPGLPTMARNLDASAGMVQLTVTVFVVGLAAGQLVVGPLSDARGRRPVLVSGLVVYLMGSLVCLVAPSVGWLVAARVGQSLGAATATVLSRAVVRDHGAGPAMTRFLATLMLVNGAATVLGPILGGQILAVATWRVVFLVLALLAGVLLLAVALALPESLPRGLRRPAHPRATGHAFRGLLRDSTYVRTVLAASLMFAAMFAYISSSSFVLQDGYGISAQRYSLVFAANAVGIALFGQISSLLLGRVADEATLLRLSLMLGTVAGAGVLVAVLAHLPLAALLVPLFVLVSLLGPVLVNSTSLALGPHADAAGTASSLQGVLQYLVGGLVASAVGLLGGHQAHTLAIAMGAAMFTSAAAAMLVFSIRPQPRPTDTAAPLPTSGSSVAVG